MRKFKKPSKKLVIIAVAILLTISAAVFFLISTNTNEPQDEIVTYSTNTPDENPPDDRYKWAGGPDDPKYISLPTIEAGGFIQKVGVDQNQQVAVPTNIHIAGWFVDSVLPGQTGLSIIDGHVDGRVETGIFLRLGELKEGDRYEVEFGDGSKKTFEVTKNVTIDTKDAANILFSQDPSISNQLNLVTCGGNFDASSQQYEKRIITYSKLVN